MGHKHGRTPGIREKFPRRCEHPLDKIGIVYSARSHGARFGAKMSGIPYGTCHRYIYGEAWPRAFLESLHV